MARQLTSLLLISIISTVFCGELTVLHSPNEARFGSGSELSASSLDDIVAASLGYTPKETSPWRALTLTSPFGLPVAAVVMEVHAGGASIRQEGLGHYQLIEDTTMNEVYHGIKNVIGKRAQRETLFKYLSIDDNLVDDGFEHDIPRTNVLNMSKEPDATFLREMASFIKTAQTVEGMTSTKAVHGGQDVIFMELNAFAPLVKAYGINSPQVKEAEVVLRDQMERVTDILRRVFGDRVLIMSATINKLKQLSRSSRSILQANDYAAVDLNLAAEYSENYPVIFNMILWMSIILILFIAGASYSMAYMDPGQDSIIYRMTNPRMKKDN